MVGSIPLLSRNVSVENMLASETLDSVRASAGPDGGRYGR